MVPAVMAERVIKADLCLQISNSKQFKRQACEAIDGMEVGEKLILDFHNTIDIDGAGLGVLIRIRRKCLEHKVQLVLKNLSEPLLQRFEDTKTCILFAFE